jgi:hypothetical protein
VSEADYPEDVRQAWYAYRSDVADVPLDVFATRPRPEVKTSVNRSMCADLGCVYPVSTLVPCVCYRCGTPSPR